MTISFKILRTIDWSKVDIWLLDMEIAHDPAGRYRVFNKRFFKNYNCLVCKNEYVLIGNVKTSLVFSD